MKVAVGVDVGKANLDVSVSEGSVVRFDSTKVGIAKLLKYLGEHGVTLVVCEATSGYERALVSRLRKDEVAIHVAHPNRVRAFAKACGYEVKTDHREPRYWPGYTRFCWMNAVICSRACCATSVERSCSTPPPSSSKTVTSICPPALRYCMMNSSRSGRGCAAS